MQIQLPVVDYRLLRVIRYFYHQNHCTLLLFYKYICYVGVLQIVDYDFNVILFSKFTECLDLHPQILLVGFVTDYRIICKTVLKIKDDAREAIMFLQVGQVDYVIFYCIQKWLVFNLLSFSRKLTLLHFLQFLEIFSEKFLESLQITSLYRVLLGIDILHNLQHHLENPRIRHIELKYIIESRIIDRFLQKLFNKRRSFLRIPPLKMLILMHSQFQSRQHSTMMIVPPKTRMDKFDRRQPRCFSCCMQNQIVFFVDVYQIDLLSHVIYFLLLLQSASEVVD